MNRRIGGRLRIRNPYYAEMKRDLPYDAYRTLELSIKNSTLQHFKEPHCDIAGNRKGTVIAFTSEKGVLQLFTMLSGKKEEEVKRYFRRSLKRRGKAKLIVNTEKDFSLIYKFNKGQIPPGTRIFFRVLLKLIYHVVVVSSLIYSLFYSLAKFSWRLYLFLCVFSTFVMHYHQSKSNKRKHKLKQQQQILSILQIFILYFLYISLQTVQIMRQRQLSYQPFSMEGQNPHFKHHSVMALLDIFSRYYNYLISKNLAFFSSVLGPHDMDTASSITCNYTEDNKKDK